MLFRSQDKTCTLKDKPEEEEIATEKQKKIRPPKQPAKNRKNSATRSDYDKKDGAELYSGLAALKDSSSDESLHCVRLGEDFEPFDIENAQTH